MCPTCEQTEEKKISAITWPNPTRLQPDKMLKEPGGMGGIEVAINYIWYLSICRDGHLRGNSGFSLPQPFSAPAVFLSCPSGSAREPGISPE